MRRRVFTILSAISLLLCVATAGLWARSYWRRDALARIDSVQWKPQVLVRVGSADGIVFLNWRQPSNAPSPAVEWRMFWGNAPIFAPPDPQLNCRFDSEGLRLNSAAPHWSFVLALALLPAISVVRKCRAATLPGACRRCGYDLRATPDRCPECGAVPAAAGEPRR